MVSRRPWVVPPIWRGAAPRVRRRAADPGEPPPGSRHSGMTVQGRGKGDIEAAHTDLDQRPELQQLQARRAVAKCVCGPGRCSAARTTAQLPRRRRRRRSLPSRSLHFTCGGQWWSCLAQQISGQRCYDRPMGPEFARDVRADERTMTRRPLRLCYLDTIAKTDGFIDVAS